MIKINRIENCYGLQNYNHILQTSFGRSRISKGVEYIDLNFIYGVNMSGKSSIVKVFKNLKSGKSIDNKRSTDGTPYVDIEINKSKVVFKSGKWINSDEHKDNIFIYDKQFVNENYTTIEKVGYIGKNASEYYELLNKENVLKIKPADIKKTAQKISNISNKGDFKGFGTNLKFSSLYSNGDVSFNTIVEVFGKASQDKPFSISEEIYLKNYKLLMFEKVDISIIDNILDRIESFSNKLGEKYKIRTLDSLEFYQTVKNYLLNNQIEECPICLRTFDDSNSKNDITNQIEKEIKDFLSNEDFKNVLSRLQEYNKIDSNYVEDFRNIIHRLTGEADYVSMEEISQLKSNINSFYEEVDSFLLSNIVNFYSNSIIEYISIRDKKNIIYIQNKQITDSVLLKTFNDLLQSSSFPLSDIIEATLDENEPFIRISIKNSNDSLKDYFTVNASEGEKSLLSILYYFAIVLNSSTNLKDAICVIDDPIDSHNNQNKYLIMDFIARNLISNKLFNLIFTHSAEVVKFSRSLVSPNTKIYLLTNEHNNGLFELNRKHYRVFDGLFDFFKGAVINKSTDNIAFKAVALVVVLREYISQTKVFSENLICKNSSGELNNYVLFEQLSNRAIHFNISDDYMTVEELVNIYKNNIEGYKLHNSVIADYDKVKNTKLNQYIAKRLVYKEYEIENLSMNIMLKNLWALYIRTNMEKLVYDFTVKALPNKYKVNSFTSEYSSSKCYQLGAKISLIEDEYKKYFDHVNLLKWNLLREVILKQKPIINNFHHLANSYVTPMFEIKIAELEDYNNKLIEVQKSCIN